MTEIKLYKTTPEGLKTIGMCLPFVAIGLLFITQEPIGTTNYIMGWVCTCFFGLGIPIGLFQTVDKRPQIIISESGIWDRTTNQDEVKWEQIIKAYTLDIVEQKVISIATDDTFIFKKRPYKWAQKTDKIVGAQNLNLPLGQINIDEIELTDFINRLRKESVEERSKLIKAFQIKKNNFRFPILKKIPLYIIISLTLLILTLSSSIAFWIVMGLTTISAIIALWRPGNLTIRRYAGIGIWLGFINMVLLLGAVKIYDNITKEVGEQFAIEVEEFRKQNSMFPTDIESINATLELNFIERYFANQIDYKTSDDDYELEANMLFGKPKKYDKTNSEWK